MVKTAAKKTESKQSTMTKKSKTAMTKTPIKPVTKTKKVTKKIAKPEDLNNEMEKKDGALTEEKKVLQTLPLTVRTDLGYEASRSITGALNLLLADVFALFMKTKNFHWHVSGPNFRDYHLLFDEQAAELFAMVDGLAERVRKVGGITLRSIGNIAQLQRISDNNADYVEPCDMLAELYEDNLSLTKRLRETHDICDFYNDSATTGLLDGWLDESEKRAWFLFESSRRSG